MGKHDRPVWGGGAVLFGTGKSGFGTTWGHTKQAEPPGMPERGSRDYHPADTRIAREVRQHLIDHAEVDAGAIEVNVGDGVVTLAGTVNGDRMKQLAGECALGVPGVREVHNRLGVRAPAAGTARRTGAKPG